MICHRTNPSTLYPPLRAALLCWICLRASPYVPNVLAGPWRGNTVQTWLAAVTDHNKPMTSIGYGSKLGTPIIGWLILH